MIQIQSKFSSITKLQNFKEYIRNQEPMVLFYFCLVQKVYTLRKLFDFM